MARINLLPWREERRQQRKQEFFIMLGAAAITAFGIMFLVTMHINGLIKYQEGRNSFLEEQTKTLDQKIREIKKLEETRAKLLARKQIIEELQESRSQMVHLFDSLVRTIPDGTRLETIKQQGQTLKLKGVAQSHARVSAYMRRLAQSEWLHDPDLTTIQSIPKDKVSDGYKLEFQMNIRLGKKDKVPEGEGGESS